VVRCWWGGGDTRIITGVSREIYGKYSFLAREGNATFLLGSAMYANFHFSFLTLSFFFLFSHRFIFLFISKIKYIKVKKEILFGNFSQFVFFPCLNPYLKNHQKKLLKKTIFFLNYKTQYIKFDEIGRMN